MSDKVDGTADGAAGDGTEVEQLKNSLGFEKAKNEVLLNEVLALEDELVNRSMEDFDAVISDETREFWREQLLTNRSKASVALAELARARAGGVAPAAPTGAAQAGAAGAPQAAGAGNAAGASAAAGSLQMRRALHNRALARPVVSPVASGGMGAAAGAGQGGVADERAAKIRNRAQEISRAERVPFSTAFRRAEQEIGG